MARRKKRDTPDAESGAAPGGDSGLDRLVAFSRTRLGRGLRAALLGAVVLLTLSVVLRQARAAVHRLPAYRLGSATVRFVDLPPWVDARMRAHLEGRRLLDRVGGTASLGTFDPDVERRLKESLARHPMLQAVHEVELRFPAEIRVRADVRTPIALVRTRAAVPPRWQDAAVEVPVAIDGIVLEPDAYADFLAARRPVVVVGVRAAFPGLGRRFLDTKDQVAEALEAARVANRLNVELGPGAPRVEQIDVSQFPAEPRERVRGEIVFLLSNGWSVQWGRTERDLLSVSGESGYEEKKERLRDLLETLPPRSVHAVDVRRPVVPPAR
jgi:hypothetical protein